MKQQAEPNQELNFGCTVYLTHKALEFLHCSWRRHGDNGLRHWLDQFIAPLLKMLFHCILSFTMLFCDFYKRYCQLKRFATQIVIFRCYEGFALNFVTIFATFVSVANVKL